MSDYTEDGYLARAEPSAWFKATEELTLERERCIGCGMLLSQGEIVGEVEIACTEANDIIQAYIHQGCTEPADTP